MFNSKENGFSLVELIVVLIITAILAQLGFTSFNRYVRRTKAFAAKTALKNIQRECESNRDLQIPETFTLLPIRGYSIATRDTNSCLGQLSDGKVAAIADNQEEIPNYFYDFLLGQISCDFPNNLGNLFVECKDSTTTWDFDVRDQNKISKNLAEAFKEGIILSPSSYATRDHPDHKLRSAYIIIKGKTKKEAQENAKRIGANLVDVNTKAERQWLKTQYARLVNLPDSITSFWTKQSSKSGDNSLLLDEQYFGDDGYVRNPDPNAKSLQFGIAEINMQSSSPNWVPK